MLVSLLLQLFPVVGVRNGNQLTGTLPEVAAEHFGYAIFRNDVMHVRTGRDYPGTGFQHAGNAADALIGRRRQCDDGLTTL